MVVEEGYSSNKTNSFFPTKSTGVPEVDLVGVNPVVPDSSDRDVSPTNLPDPGRR